MISKLMGPKVLMGVGAVAIAAALYIVWLKAEIDDHLLLIDKLEAQLVACNLSQEGLKTEIEQQNEKVNQFSITLEKTNTALKETEKKNRNLRKDLQTEISKIDSVQHNSCIETMNWMLQEAIDENPSIIINN
jgi:septal ring factor EnvC (AmiA/AmiB activator)